MYDFLFFLISMSTGGSLLCCCFNDPSAQMGCLFSALMGQYDFGCFISHRIHVYGIFIYTCHKHQLNVGIYIYTDLWVLNHLHNEKEPGCLGYMEDYTAQLHGDYN